MTSDILTLIGFLGACIIGLGFLLTYFNIQWLWLSVLGLAINWYGDSLDGTLARVRNCQRPIYGYYLDHTIDGINESIMFVSVGLSPLVHIYFALPILVIYLLLTINVSINAHLRKEFKLTYAKLGPTEFRIIAAIACAIYVLVKPLHDFVLETSFLGLDMTLHSLDFVAIAMLVILMIMHLVTIFQDLKYYAKLDPLKKQ